MTISTVQSIFGLEPTLWLAAGGFVLGLLFGALTLATNFCAMGAVSDVVLLEDWRRMRAWVLAAAVALLATQVLVAAGLVDTGRSIYVAARLEWVGHVLGGILFGVGMVLAGGCASRNLVRAGTGDLGALLSLIVLGLFAHIASGGVLGPLRTVVAGALAVELPARGQSLGHLLGGVPGRLLAAVAIAGAALAWCLADARFRSSRRHVLSGAGVGLLVAAGWLVTSLAHDELTLRPTPIASLTFVRPTGGAFHWLAHLTTASMPGFAIASVLGTVAGAGLWAARGSHYRLATFAGVGDALRALAGAALMGVGGVLALGCTIGQAVTGVSTLAIGAFLTFVSLVIGAVLGVCLLGRWLDRDP